MAKIRHQKRELELEKMALSALRDQTDEFAKIEHRLGGPHARICSATALLGPGTELLKADIPCEDVTGEIWGREAPALGIRLEALAI